MNFQNRLLLSLVWLAGGASPAFSQSPDTFDPAPDYAIYALAVQPDGKVLAGGLFQSLGGVARSRIARMNPDGAVDGAFAPNADGPVYSLVVQGDGRILVGGGFTNLGGAMRQYIGRLSTNGVVEASFNPGTDGSVLAMAAQADGKIVVAGNFYTLAGLPRSSIGRLNANGTPDPAYDPQAGSVVYTVALQPDGKLLVGGGFLTFGGQFRNFLCRLNVNGSVDTDFVAAAGNHVHTLAVQADGKILVGGLFTSMNGQPRNNLARLSADGTLDASFTSGISPPGFISEVGSLAVQADGKILVAGIFSDLAGQSRAYLGRLNPDGSLDSGFSPEPSAMVNGLAIQSDGKIIAGGWFTGLAGQSRNYLGRLINTSAATETFSRSGSTLTWLRGGTGPEVWRTTFEIRTNSGAWLPLGQGTRVAGGWQLTGVNGAANANLRARGFVTGGYGNSSSWFVESYLGRPLILSSPASHTNNAGTTATFDVLAAGTPPLTYRWRKNAANISGATNATLILSNVLHADAAAYSVVISNSFGAVTSAVANLTVVDPCITNQPANQYVETGQTAQFNVGAAGTSLRFQWQRNGVAISGATNATLMLTNLQGADAGSLIRVIVSNSFGAVTSAVAVLSVNVATVDALNPAPNYQVFSMLVQPDARIVLAGNFSQLNGEFQAAIARLDADGNRETNFHPALDFTAHAVALQHDRKILVGLGYDAFFNLPASRVTRLHRDGSFDTDFNPAARDDVFAIVALPDGKMIVGGNFTNLAGQTCGRLGRLNADGTLENNFNLGANGTVLALAMQPDGKLLVGGDFTTLADVARTNIGRFNSDGSLDLNFNPGANGAVNALAVQANGAILAGGEFTVLGGQARGFIGRLNTNGSLDTSFTTAASGPIHTLAIQVDGKICFGGSFTIVGGEPRTNIARLHANGNVEASFNPGADGTVFSLAVQPDGKTLVGGLFETLGGQARPNFGRLNSTGPAAQNLAFNSSTITWQRAGTGPEVWSTVFAVSTNGIDWVRVNGARIAGGWQATNLNLRSNATVVARGYVAGSSDGSSWFVESVLGPPAIESQPSSRTNNPFTTATFAISAVGQAPLGYQWFKNSLALADGGNVFGAQSAMLTLTNVLGADAGVYQLVVSNAFGSITSAVATLTVLDPLLTSQPIGRTNNAGETASFSVTAQGSAPLGFHWLKNDSGLDDGGDISGAHTSTLALNSVLGGDVAAYRVVVSNAWGSVTSSVASLTVIDPLLTSQPVGRAGHRGGSVAFSVTVIGTSPNYQWRKDGVALPGANASSLTLSNLQSVDAGNYDVIVTNLFGSVTSAVALLTVNVAPADSFNPGANNPVYALAVQTNGKILVGGAFTSLGGFARNRIARLNSDGTVDPTFNPGANNFVRCFAVQGDGRILVGGAFATLAGQPRNYLARLNADGSLDSNFNPGPDWYVYSLVEQTDGKIVVGGGFNNLGGLPRPRIGRINSDGALDTAFNPGADLQVMTLALQQDGKILAGGAFTTLGGFTRRYIGRLEVNGTLDGAFNPNADNYVGALAVQADDKILIGGGFDTVGNAVHSRIARLDRYGVADSDFNPSVNGVVNALAVQADGKIIVAGSFEVLNGETRNNIGRLNADGTLDAAFDPEADYAAYALALQEDGNILVTGFFGGLGGQMRSRIGRLSNDETAPQSLTSDNTSVTWLRGGSCPEFWRTTFETSTNGTNWISLGSGQRVPGGWQIDGLALPPNATIRARGYLAGGGGFQSSSSWLTEKIIGVPLVSTQPVSRTNNANTTATFSGGAIGGAPISYQWLKNGMVLSDGGNVFGATATTLTLSNVFGVDAGMYSLVASNSAGSMTSAVAVLTVIDPRLTAQPVSRITNAGETVVFNVSALGSAPLSFQWRKDGSTLTGATETTLTLTNVQTTNAGAYDVVVSNAFGSVTSAIATLSVNLAAPDSLNVGGNGVVSALALQADGKILVGGSFSPAGGPGRHSLSRLNADGTFDGTFRTGGYATVSCLLVQPDGKILVAGSRFELQQSSTYLWRVHGDGNVDTNFTLEVFRPGVNALALQADGKILLGGGFTSLNKESHSGLGRLNSDGLLDTNFVAGAGSTVQSLAVQPDGRILVGGSFTTLGGTNRNRLGRLFADGTVDLAFNPNVSGTVFALAVQPDGKVLLGGSFSTVGGTNHNNIARVNADGSVDLSFNPSVIGAVYCIALQTDGKIILTGTFTAVNGQPRSRLARLNADGSLDPFFNPGINSDVVYALAIQPDGAVLVGGNFQMLAGVARTNVARLINPDPTNEILSYDGSTLAWSRGGSSPEIWRVAFEQSTDGTNWTALGEGARMPGGWQLSGVTAPTNAMLRARGFATGGKNNGSAWFLESALALSPLAPPRILSEHSGFSSNQFGFGIGALSGQVVVIEASTNLTQWTSLATNTIGVGPFFFRDMSATNLPWRFYRVRLQ